MREIVVITGGDSYAPVPTGTGVISLEDEGTSVEVGFSDIVVGSIFG